MPKKYPSKYHHAAGGWGALASTSKYLIKSKKPVRNIRTLLKTNQHKGFDCPGCAWGDQKKASNVSFCENGAKAINWEATSRKVGADFFSKNSVTYLNQQTDYFLEYQGRLIEPMRYNIATDHYEPISWDDAFMLIAKHLNTLESPHQAEFYTSGRASNEAAFLYQLFVRTYGTNNFPDCSNMCHEASAIAMNESLGVGKGTVTLEDFEKADAIFVLGQNPGTNHPRMLDTLRDAAKKGCKIVTFNNLRERALERFTHPQSPKEMLTNGHTQISSHYYMPRLGGDMAAVRGIVKALLAQEDQAQQHGQASILDWPFIREHTDGLEDYINHVRNTPWVSIEQQSGLSQQQLTDIAHIYANAKRVICSWAMGLTQHKHSVIMLQEVLNLLLLRGNIGRPGTGACPVRGHSNVQGDRTMGINEKAPKELIDQLERVFKKTFPREPGHNAIQAVQAMQEGRAKVFFALGGNFAAAMPDTDITRAALRRCDLVVNVSTKLNRSHLTPGNDALILPCLGRTEIDLTAYGEQRITVEDSMSMVHSSGGVLNPVSRSLKSETAIIAHLAHATLGNNPIQWLEVAKDNSKIRELIGQTIPGFHDFNQRLEAPGGFYLGNKAAQRVWQTPTGKAQFMAHLLPEHIIDQSLSDRLVNKKVFNLQTLRSHDQYNTTVYGYDDRYRGIKGMRNVLFVNPDDLATMNLDENQEVVITSHWVDGSQRHLSGFSVVPYDIPLGNIAAYYPETNPLVPLQSYGDKSFTPTSKSITVTIQAAKYGIALTPVE